MKSHFLLATATAALMAVPSIAFADDDSGWYLRGQAGYGIHGDNDFVGDINGNAESEGNFTGSLGLGYDFDSNWRLELDVAQLFTSLGRLGDFTNSFAKIRGTSGNINLLYDFDDFGDWEPYVGAGIGLLRGSTSVEVGAPGGINCGGAANCLIDDRDTGLAWQVLAGLGYDITDNLVWDTQYRYQNGPEFDFEGLAGGAPAASSYEYEAHSLLSGFRYRFGAAPAPVPTVAPVIQQNVAVYTCPDGSIVNSVDARCRIPGERVAQYTCWDGSVVSSATAKCPVQTVETQREVRRAVVAQPVVVQSYNNCGPSNIDIFNLNYLFKSMGYTNGFKDAQAYMFSEETLPVGTSGILGLGKEHHYAYSILPSNNRDREAFRIQSANGTAIHFMKSCGNYFYPCN